MSHIVGEGEWGVVDLDVDRGHVFVREDWRYDHWRLDTDPNLRVTPWTQREKASYHRAVDRLVWGFWSMRATFKAEVNPRGNLGPRSALVAERLAKKTLTCSFDVRHVYGAAHWTVTVTKVNPGKHPKPSASVHIAERALMFYSTDVLRGLTGVQTEKQTVDEAGALVGGKGRFRVSAHEFGHTLMNPDEYKNSPFIGDYHSLMNIGRQMRPRHLQLIVEALETLVPGCRFRAIVQ
jgi:hypothetical protein